jgi:hypothetical protein
MANLALHPSRITVCLGLILVLGAMSLPFVAGEGLRRDSLQADALPALLLLLPALVISLLPDLGAPVRSRSAWVALAGATTAFAYSLVVELNAAAQASSLGAGTGAGGLLLAFGTLVTATGVALGLVWEKAGWPVSAPPAASTASTTAGRERSVPPAPTLRSQRPLPTTARSPRPAPPPPPERTAETGRRAPSPTRRQPDSSTTPPQTPTKRPPAAGSWWPEDLDDLFK